MGRRSPLTASLVLLSLLFSLEPAGADLPKDVAEKLQAATYVYIASTRRNGTLGKPSEIWFFYEAGALYVGTPATSWRVRRIRAGRPQAKVWVGEPNGPRRVTVTEREIQGLPSFKAKGEIVNDGKMHERLREVFAKKYPEDWPDHVDLFRFEDGKRVMVRYTPID